MWSWEIVVTIALGLLGLGVMAGQGFSLNPWTIGFWAAAAILIVVRIVHGGENSDESPRPALNTFNRRPELPVRHDLSIEVRPGVARPDGKRTLVSADVLVTNKGQPISLVAHAALLGINPKDLPGVSDRWEYEPRTVKGSHGRSWYHIATLEQTTTGDGVHWLVKVRGEYFTVIRRWEGNGPLVFESEWSLYSEVESTLTEVGKVVVRTKLSDDRRSFVVEVV